MRLTWPSTTPGPRQAEPVGDGVLVGAQPGDEGTERRLTGGEGSGHPSLEPLAAAALGHDGGEVADAGGDRGQFRGGGEDRGCLRGNGAHGCADRDLVEHGVAGAITGFRSPGLLAE
jgi:hypothetical protein